MLNFEFLEESWTEWIHIYESAMAAVIYTESDPLVACMYARRALEIAVKWMYKNDPELSSSNYSKDSTLYGLITLEKFQSFVDPMILIKCQVITQFGNRAIHELDSIESVEAKNIVIRLYEVCLWLASTYPNSQYKSTKYTRGYISKLLSELKISRSVKPPSFDNKGIGSLTRNTIGQSMGKLNYSNKEKELLSLTIKKALEESFYKRQISIAKSHSSMGKRIIHNKYIEFLENFKQAVNSTVKEDIIEHFIQKNCAYFRQTTIEEFTKYKEDILLDFRQKLNECEAFFCKTLSTENFILTSQQELHESENADDRKASQ
ncbi:hypothetical protein Syn7502_02779 [Synechococcus sp. PCC 7502]|uniref:DUF4145 domain-containing protein n=1 Tax=Synechococcus sp. PCC 7502 TaxID=1173263 RepID=UPI00029FF779|nr:DUF4145 domain-containing protein [Synechococcus sp. PCC 7502]AFY74717.1 hypothetical protein Syn7502_02779 [Synechococcus sp. PCC 7502]